MPELKELQSKAAKAVPGSEIRRLLSLGEQIEISMGGGYPSVESFPVKDILFSFATLAWHLKSFPHILQYGLTEGYPPFVEAVQNFLKNSPSRKINASPENILITTASQQALDIIGALCIDSGDFIGVERPTYLGALQAFSYYGPNYVEIPTDDEGIIPEALHEISKEKKLKFLYLIPTFQNPTGKAASLKRKEELAEVITRHNLLCIEDDPYSELRYEGETSPALQSLAPDNVIHLFTFSKTLAPAFRLGGIVAPKEIRDAAARIKQGKDLNTGYFTQAIAAEYIKSGRILRHIPEIKKLYRPKQQEMIKALEKFLPSYFDFTRPQGGMFEWVFLKPEYEELCLIFDPVEVRDELLKYGIAVVPGTPFFADPKTAQVSWRLNFTSPKTEKIGSAIKIFGDILNQRSTLAPTTPQAWQTGRSPAIF